MSAEFHRTKERHRRIRLTKRLLRYLPRRATLHRYPVLSRFAAMARRRPYLWSFRVRVVTPSFYAGCIIALMPFYGFQIPLAFAAALALRSNLPVAVALQFITNPLTLWIYYFTYAAGESVINAVGYTFPDSRVGQVIAIPAAASVGGLVCGLVLGAILDIVYRFLAYEAQKHHWHIPRRKPHPPESPPPSDPPIDPSI